MKSPYYPTAPGLYFDYLVHGMGAILMSLNMASLETLRQINVAGVSIVISSLGIGRLGVLFFAGLLSDRFGHRLFIMLGICCHMALFSGILYTNNIIIAYVFDFLVGTANSFLNAGTYPSLMRAFPRSPGTADILIEAFASNGQFLLSLIISLLVWVELWSGWSLMTAAGIMSINALFLYRCTFLLHPGCHLPVIKGTTNSTEYRCSIIDLASYSPYGYISMVTFYLVSRWLAQYGQFVVGMSCTTSIKLFSVYTVDSLLCVFITAPLIRNTVCSTTLLMLYTFISFTVLPTVCLHPTPYVAIIFAFVIGSTSASDVAQISLTSVAERFPYARGKATEIYYNAGSITTFTIPLITAHLSQRNIANIMWSDAAIVAIGFILAPFIGLRSHRETRHHMLKENIAPGG